jgi:hypothetical protein
VTSYQYADEVQDIALHLINEVDEYSPLINVEVRYVWRDKHAKSKGGDVYGKARKISGLSAFLARALDPDLGFFVIEIARDLWVHLEEHQQRALVDHELAHLIVTFNEDDGLSLSIRGHDLEEFFGVVRRHGAWRPEISTLSQLAGQQRLAVADAVNAASDGGFTINKDRL